jgi:hypothetical protein
LLQNGVSFGQLRSDPLNAAELYSTYLHINSRAAHE